VSSIRRNAEALRQRRGRLAAWRYLLKRHPVLYQVRYALILRLGGRGFDREPGAVRRRGVPEVFTARVSGITREDGTWDAARRISYALSRGHPRGPGMGVDSVRALAGIEAGGAGVCSDYSQVFLGLCRAAGVPAREWGLCEGFDGEGVGHTMAEVWANELGRWVFLDPFYSLYVVAEDGECLSMTELVDRTAAGNVEGLRLRDIDPDGAAGERRQRYLERYFQGGRHFFLLTGNDVFRQDPFLRHAGWLPTPALHLLMICCGAYPRFQLYGADEGTARQVRTLRWRLAAGVLAGLGLAGLLAFAVVQH
jgi:hypothetical protein